MIPHYQYLGWKYCGSKDNDESEKFENLTPFHAETLKRATPKFMQLITSQIHTSVQSFTTVGVEVSFLPHAWKTRSLLHFWDSFNSPYAHHCSGPPVSEMTYTVLSGTLNSTIPYHTMWTRPAYWDSHLHMWIVCADIVWSRSTKLGTITNEGRKNFVMVLPTPTCGIRSGTK